MAESTDPFTFQWLADDVMLSTLTSTYRISRDVPLSDAAGCDQLESHGTPVWVIQDVTELHASLDDIIHVSNFETRTGNMMMKHPLIKGIVFVVRSDFLKLVAKGLRAPIFGVNAFTADSIAEALEIIKQQA